jgi:DNA-binding NarL/FixJ family response regulator
LDNGVINVLFVDDDAEAVKFVEVVLRKVEEFRFRILPKDSGESALQELESNKDIDLIIMDYFLPGVNGFDTAKAIFQKNYRIPIIFLTVNRDMNIAIEAMKLGVADYILKEDLNNAFFVRTILGVLQKQKLLRELSELEVKKKRLEALQEMIIGITGEVSRPLNEMKRILLLLSEKGVGEKDTRYLKLMQDNVDRIEQKIERLRNLKDDKTVQYIKDIKMIDLS